MSILDKLRPQPDWKDADPGVRIVAVQQLAPEGADADGILSQVVRDDTDARVRQAAAERLGNPQLLKTVVSDDPDEAVRATAVATLLDLACSSEGRVGRCGRAGRPHRPTRSRRRRKDCVARGDRVCRPAAGHRNQVARCGGTARRPRRRPPGGAPANRGSRRADHGRHQERAQGRGARGARRLFDEPVPPEDAIGAIAARAKNKVTARRAKAALRDREQAAASVAVDDAATAERQEGCTQLDALADSVDWSAVTDGLREAEGAWAKLPPIEPAALSRSASAPRLRCCGPVSTRIIARRRSSSAGARRTRRRPSRGLRSARESSKWMAIERRR